MCLSFHVIPHVFPHIWSQRQNASASEGENGSPCSQMRGWVSARAHWSVKSHLRAVQLALVVLTSAALAKERKHTSERTDRNSSWGENAHDTCSYSLEELQPSRMPADFLVWEVVQDVSVLEGPCLLTLQRASSSTCPARPAPGQNNPGCTHLPDHLSCPSFGLYLPERSKQQQNQGKISQSLMSPPRFLHQACG